MTYEILINVTPQETRVAMLEQGVVQELHIERASARGLVGNIYLGRVARVLPGMQSAFIEIGLERAAFLHIADIWEHRQNGHGGGAKPIEKILHEGAVAARAGDQGPDRHQGRAPVDAGEPRRPAARLPAAGLAHRHLAAHRATRPSARALRERLQQLLPEGLAGGFIIRTMAETASEREMQKRHRVPDQAVGRPDRALARSAAGVAAVPGPEPRAARAARHVDRGDRADPGRLARDVS